MIATTRGRPDVVVTVGVAISGLAVVTALVVLALRTWTPYNDEAVIWLRIDDVGTVDTPLTGLYSRFGWDHPGPLVFYLLTVPFRVLGGRPSALMVGAVLIAVAAAVTAVWAAYRAGSLGAALPIGVVTAVVAISLGGGLIDPWTPYTVVLPLVAFVCALWAWLGADRVALPVAAVLGTFLVQTHVSLAVPVLVIGVVAIVWRLIERTPLAPAWRRPPWVTLTVLVVLWAPPVTQQLFGEDGNLTALWSHFTSPSETTAGFTDGLGRAARALWPAGPWVGRTGSAFLGEIPLAPIWWLMAPFLLLTLAALLAWRWRDQVTIRLVSLIAIGHVATVLALARIDGIPFAYLTYWSRAVAGLTVALPLVAVGRRLLGPAEGGARDRRAIIAVISGVVAVVALVGMSRPSPLDEFGARYRTLVADVPALVPPGTTVRVDAAGDALAYSAPTLVIAFEDQGRHALLAPLPTETEGQDLDIAGEANRAPSDAVLPTFVVTTGSAVNALAARPGARVVSTVDPLEATERAEADALRDSLREQALRLGRPDLVEAIEDPPGVFVFGSLEGLDADEVARYLDLTRRGAPISVVQLPPTTWPAP